MRVPAHRSLAELHQIVYAKLKAERFPAEKVPDWKIKQTTSNSVQRRRAFDRVEGRERINVETNRKIFS